MDGRAGVSYCDFSDMPAMFCAHCRGLGDGPDLGLTVRNKVACQYPTYCAVCNVRIIAGEWIHRCAEVDGWVCEGCVA